MIGDADLQVVHKSKRDWCFQDFIVLVVPRGEFVVVFGYFSCAYLLVS